MTRAGGRDAPPDGLSLAEYFDHLPDTLPGEPSNNSRQIFEQPPVGATLWYMEENGRMHTKQKKNVALKKFTWEGAKAWHPME